MDVLCSPSKIRPKSVEVIFVDDSDSPSSSYPSSRNQKIFDENEIYSDINIITESESFVSTSDELIADASSDDNDENIDIVITETKIIQSQEKSLSSFSDSSIKISDKNKDIPKKLKTNNKNNSSKIYISSSSDDDDTSSLIYSNSLYSSQIDGETSYFSSSVNISKIPQRVQVKNNTKYTKKAKNKKNRNNYVHDLDDFIEQDEDDFEEEEMNSSDRNFIASDSQPINDISFYRHCDIDKPYHRLKTKSKNNNTSSSESDFESSSSA